MQGSEERLRPAGLRQARAREPQGAHRPQPADRRAHQDPREARVQVPPRQADEGRGAWQEVARRAAAVPGPRARRVRARPGARRRRAGRRRSTTPSGPGSGRISSFIPSPTRRRHGRCSTSRRCRGPIPRASRSAGAPLPPAAALVAAVLAERAGRAVAAARSAREPRRPAAAPSIPSTSPPSSSPPRSITRPRSAPTPRSRAPQGLDRVWIRFGFIPVPESALPGGVRRTRRRRASTAGAAAARCGRFRDCGDARERAR